jgi:hypothetical protein
MVKTLDKEDIELNKLCDGQMSTLPSPPRWYKLRLFMMRLPKLRFGHIEKFIYILNKLLGSKNEKKGRTDNNA